MIDVANKLGMPLTPRIEGRWYNTNSASELGRRRLKKVDAANSGDCRSTQLLVQRPINKLTEAAKLGED